MDAGRDNENTLCSPRRIGNQLCFADLRPTKGGGGSTDNPEHRRILKAFSEAHMNNDAAAIAALFTRDAVFVTPEGPITGPASPSEMAHRPVQWWHPKDRITKLDGPVQLIGTAGNELWATGEWSETGQGKNGEPLPINNHWLCINVRGGDDWKIRLDAWNTTPDTVIRVHQSFAPQPAATPSSNASPS